MQEYMRSTSSAILCFLAIPLWMLTGCDQNQQSDVQAEERHETSVPLDGSLPAMTPESFLTELEKVKNANTQEMPAHYERVFRALTKEHSVMAHLLMPAIILRWQELNTPALFAYAINHPAWASSEIFDQDLLLEVLFEHDAEALIAFLNNQYDQVQKDEFAFLLAQVIAEDDPKYILIDELFGRDVERLTLQAQFDKLEELAGTDPQAALRALEEFTFHEDFAFEFSSVLEAASQLMPEAAARMALDYAQVYPEKVDYFADLIHNWMRQSPADALTAIDEVASWLFEDFCGGSGVASRRSRLKFGTT